MKKYVVLIVSLFLLLINETNAQIKVAPKLGVNFANFAGDLDYGHLRIRMLIGGVVDYEINEMFSFQPGLQLSGKGSTFKWDDGDNDAFNLAYLEVPLNGVVSVDVEPGKLQFFAGPYLAYCVKGTYKFLADDNNATEAILIGTSEDDEIKPFDLGINIGAGFLYENMQVQAGFSGSITNISNYVDDRLVNRMFTITFAYFFNLD